ncbi:hypothetical protein [Kitasatospora sp. NPDC050543]|uniref:hypothetical protein n=1 Tax=Kitasatospora sp. NPDC050543 TaxID=3364054 RepID=UPI0037B70618
MLDRRGVEALLGEGLQGCPEQRRASAGAALGHTLGHRFSLIGLIGRPANARLIALVREAEAAGPGSARAWSGAALLAEPISPR